MIEIELPGGVLLEVPTDDLEQAKKIASKWYAANKNSLRRTETVEDVTVEEPKKLEIDRSGVQNAGLRRFLARADNDEETEKRLKSLGFTSEMFEKDPEQEGYLLNLDRVSNNLKDQYDLKGTGLLSIEDKGLTRRDFGEFFSKHRGPIIGGTAASIAATGFGLPLAMVIAGAGSGAGYLVDEGIEYSADLQAQDANEVVRQAAMETVFGGLGEGGGRLLSSLFGRLLKGPGGKEANEARQAAREAIDQGARPTVLAANTAPVIGRLQAIYEGVFPNKTAATNNANAVIKQLKEIQPNTPEADYEQLLSVVKRDIEKIYGEPTDLLKQANDNLKNIVDKEVAELVKMYGKPSAQTGRMIAESLDLSKRTFDQDSQALFSRASELLGDKPLVNVKNVKNTLQKLNTGEGAGLDLINKSFGRFVMNMDDVVDVATANSLRTTLNHASFDPSIVGSQDKAILTKLTSAIQDSFRETEAVYSAGLKEFAEKGRLKGPDGRFLGKAETQQLSDGFKALRDANRFYQKGVDRFKPALVAKLFESYKTGFDFNPEDLMKPQFGLLVPGNGATLRKFLNSVVPSGRDAQPIPQTVADVVPERMIELRNGQQVPMKELVESLPETDALRRHYNEILADQQRFGQAIAAGRGRGADIREATRKALAGKYLENMFDGQRDLLGKIDAAKIANQIRDLGTTGRVLFKNDYNQVLKGLEDMAALGKGVNETDLAGLAGRPITEQIEQINALTKADKDLKGIPLFRQLETAVRAGDEEKIVDSVLKKNNVSAIKEAQRLLNDTLESPSPTMEAIRDKALSRILAKAGDPEMMTGADFTEALISGKHAKALRSSLDAYGRKTLDQLFGKETTDGLYKLAEMSRLSSNDPIKGLGGLAPASIVAGLGAAGFITAPLATLQATAGLFVMSKLLRSKPYLKMITAPRGVRPGQGDFDKIGIAFETAYRLAAQQQAAAATDIRDRTNREIEQVNQTVSSLPAPVQTAARAATAPRSVSAPLRADYSGVNADLLGSNPITQAKNLQIAERLR